MSNLMIQDLSRTEELGAQALAAIRGGHGHPPYGKAWGYYKKDCYEPKKDYVPVSEVSVAQAGVGIFNFSNVDFEGSISITTNGPVTATATA